MSEELRREVNLFGTVRYCNKNGDIHRLDGPAVEFINGCKDWWQNGKRHRLEGPAYEEPSGYKEWWVDGKLHREDGPAVEYSDGTKEWYIDGKYYKTEKEWEKARCPSIEEAIKMFKGVNP